MVNIILRPPYKMDIEDLKKMSDKDLQLLLHMAEQEMQRRKNVRREEERLRDLDGGRMLLGEAKCLCQALVKKFWTV